MLWLGTGAFQCCDRSITSDSNESYELATFKPVQGDKGNISSYIYLEEGYYYPLRVVYVNINDEAYLSVAFTDPNGNTIDLSDVIYTPDQNTSSGCYQTTVTMPPLISTVTSGTISTSYTTLVTLSTSGTGFITTSEIVTVVPTTPVHTATITSGTVSTSYTTEITVTPSSGTPYSTSEIVTVVPTTPLPTSTTVSGTVSSSYTTLVTFTSSGSTITTSEIVTIVPTTPHNSGIATIATGCSFASVSKLPGFNIKYYSYPHANTVLCGEPGYLASEYKTETLYSSATGVTSVTFDITDGVDTSYTMDYETTTYYGMTIYKYHFTFEYTGFFKRKLTF